KLRQVLAEKDSRCQALQRNISDHLDELAQVFSGDKPLTRVQKNAKLQAWFLQLKTTVEELQFDGQSVESTGRKLVQMCSRLTEVQDLHNLDSHISVRQFLQEINDLMQQLLRTINIKDDKLAQIQTISDLTYAWDIIDQYTPYMQDGIKRDPSMAMKLRATFLKLSSALALPLLRIEQAESPDLVSVSQFYSRELVVYVRRVLQVVPETVFSLLNSIVRLQTDAIHELPTRLDKDKMKEHATLDSRYEMARLTHSISVLTEGILMMKTTLVGIIRVDPKQVLEDGVRRELVQKLSFLMHQTLAFNPKAKQSELEPKLLILAEQMEAVKRSFAYISDYISLSGYRLWQEELTRTIGYAVEQECNAYLTHKILDDDSIYQSRVIPLPKFQPIDGQSATFIGRLIRELLKETDPKTTIFASTLRTWYDAKTKQPRASPQLFKSLKAAISTVGMSGLNRLCGFMIVDRLRRFFVDYRAQFVENLAWSAFLQSMDDSMATSAAAQTTTPQTKLFENAVAKGGKLFAHCIEQLCMIGQLQLIRMHLAREIANTAHFESRQLTLSLQTLNQALLGDIAAHAADPSKPYPAEDNALMYEVSEYLEQSGATDPLLKIYICPPKLPNVACALFFTVLSALPKLTYMDSIGLIAKKPSDGLDGIPFVIGIATLLKQHHPSETAAFINHCAVLVNSFVHSVVRPTSGKPSFDLSADVGMMLSFLAEFSLLAGIRKSDMEAMLPAVLLDHYRACIPTSN
uniref:Uncharacterized protein n=1 Tax=Plectus sambesii TaxID=2011161 RepID=A0A914XAT2_9BILA